MIWLMVSSRSDQRPTHVGEQFRNVSVEAGTQCAVDDAVVGRQRQRQNQARNEFGTVPYRLHHRFADAENGMIAYNASVQTDGASYICGDVISKKI